MSGWKLSAALLGKQFGNIGNSLAQRLAAFDPETATEVDRDNLKAELRGFIAKLAEHQAKYNVEKKEADDLAAQIAKDEAAAAVLLSKFDAGQIDEATLTEFANNLEAMKARLPGEQQDVVDAKQLLDTYQGLVDQGEKKLADFDANAQKAKRALAQAQADLSREQQRLKAQDELRAATSGQGAHATGMGALAAKTEQLRVQAEASRIEADIGQRPLDRMNAVEEARRIAAGTNTPAAESAADRLRRLTGK